MGNVTPPKDKETILKENYPNLRFYTTIYYNNGQEPEEDKEGATFSELTKQFSRLGKAGAVETFSIKPVLQRKISATDLLSMIECLCQKLKMNNTVPTCQEIDTISQLWKDNLPACVIHEWCAEGMKQAKGWNKAWAIPVYGLCWIVGEVLSAPVSLVLSPILAAYGYRNRKYQINVPNPVNPNPNPNPNPNAQPNYQMPAPSYDQSDDDPIEI